MALYIKRKIIKKTKKGEGKKLKQLKSLFKKIKVS